MYVTQNKQIQYYLEAFILILLVRINSSFTLNNLKSNQVPFVNVANVFSSKTKRSQLSQASVNSQESISAEKRIERTLYKLNPFVSSLLQPNEEGAEFQLEEQTEFRVKEDGDNEVIKHFIIRGKPDATLKVPSADENKPRKRVIRVGSELFRISLPAEDSFYKEGGESKWESSIAMILFFASRPELLYGKVIEISSETGLGGILSIIAAFKANSEGIEMESLTLTDPNPSISIIGTSNAEACNLSGSICQTQVLDWRYATKFEEYQTILAADCAYLFPDVKQLTKALAYLLSPKDSQGKLFYFGPYQRNVIRDIQTELERKYKMEVNLGLMEMDVLQLEDSTISTDNDKSTTFCPINSKRTKEFLVLESQHDEAYMGEGEDFFLPDGLDYGVKRDLEPEEEVGPLW